MKVQCVFQRGDPLPAEVLRLGNTTNSAFPIKYGRQYAVYSISLWKGVIHYLILNEETNRPDWIPATFFRVLDSRLPSGWSFAMGDGDSLPVEAIWGYPEITQAETKHYVDLIERDERALELFQRRRMEIEA
jgi:hypothetical protein